MHKHVFLFYTKGDGYIKVGRNPFTDEEEKYLIENYATATWEEIFEHMPNRRKDSIAHKAMKLGIVRRKTWSKKGIDLLKKVYSSDLSVEEISQQIFQGKYTAPAIQTKAHKLRLEKSARWTDEELKLLFQYYPILQPDEMAEMLPRHPKGSIICKANENELVSFRYWGQNEIDYLLEHYSTKSDEEIAQYLHRTSEAVRGQRDRMKLYHPIERCIYEDIPKFLRHKIRPWRRKSIEHCNNQCIITGSKTYDVHHLYAFNLILFETLKKIDFPLKENFTDYSEEELQYLTDEFLKMHNSYPLGICIDRNLHKQFHSMYGHGNNTPEQFKEFLNKQNIRIRNDYVLAQ